MPQVAVDQDAFDFRRFIGAELARRAPLRRRVCPRPFCVTLHSEPEARFCRNCGKPLTEPVRRVEPKRCRCDQMVHRPGARFCHRCGTNFETGNVATWIPMTPATLPRNPNSHPCASRAPRDREIPLALWARIPGWIFLFLGFPALFDGGWITLVGLVLIFYGVGAILARWLQSSKR